MDASAFQQFLRNLYAEEASKFRDFLQNSYSEEDALRSIIERPFASTLITKTTIPPVYAILVRRPQNDLCPHYDGMLVGLDPSALVTAEIGHCRGSLCPAACRLDMLKRLEEEVQKVVQEFWRKAPVVNGDT